jgi:beta-glucosidase
MDKKAEFPEDFLWGASTASHQVEGGTHNQWSEWELKNADELARTAKKQVGWVPVWDKIEKQATDPANYISGNGIEHYTRYREDFDILQELGLNAFRFGIEWSRVQPTEDSWDEAAIEHYHEYIDELNRRGIEPVLTLWHWTMPVWFTDKGGLEKRQNLQYFDRYVERMAEEFGNKVHYIITVNEPSIYASFGYQIGEWPPQRKNLIVFLGVFYNLVLAHRRAYKILKAKNPDLQIGVAAQLANMQPKNPASIFDRIGTKIMAYFGNWWYLNRIDAVQDFVGFNYYFTNYCSGFRMKNPGEPLNDLGWYMEPGGIKHVLVELERRYHKPVLMTEDGLADMDDKCRQWWLKETMTALIQAKNEGSNIIGYLHWSLLDNFEWKYGWWPKFGLVAVDREHDMKRTIRPSARWWADYIKKHTSAINSVKGK